MESIRTLRRVSAGIALVAVCLISPAPAPAANTEAAARTVAPDFTLNNYKGASVRLSKLKGKVVLLNFWATWCHGCKLEIPWFTEFESKYKHSGLAVIGVSMDEDGWKSVKPFLKEKKLNYPIVVGDEDMAKRYGGVETMPMTLLIDRGGRIAASYQGMVDKNACESEIRMLLQQRASAAR